jgi:hypothetical protein
MTRGGRESAVAASGWRVSVEREVKVERNDRSISVRKMRVRWVIEDLSALNWSNK